MAGRKRRATRSSNGAAAGSYNEEPNVYQEMLVEAGVATLETGSSVRPLKRRRPGSGVVPKLDEKVLLAEAAEKPAHQEKGYVGDGDGDGEIGDDSDEDVEFQDVVIPVPTVQTMEWDSDDEDDEDDDGEVHFEDVDFTAHLQKSVPEAEQPQQLELNLSAQKSASIDARKVMDRRKPITKEEKERRIGIHKAHLLCLLAHLARRNHWCNDPKVQERLRAHLTDKTVSYLNPGANLSQFGRTESLKNGLRQAADVWKTKFEITERGLRRSLWAEEAEHLQGYELPSDMESCLDRKDLGEAARKLQGSRDIGAQLYCALLRSAGVRSRLVCSLQPLCFDSRGPSLPKPKESKNPSKVSKAEKTRTQLEQYKEMANKAASATASGSRPTARRRLGHPSATAYNFEPSAPPPKTPKTFEAPKRIRESAYPVYWVEVLDVGHQKWQPADPVVTHTFWKPKAFEPPITDKENCLCYVVAFDADGTAKDVTRRYAKAYTAKTRRLRVDGVVENGDAWWRKVMKMYRNKRSSDLDQIEENELAGVEAREPMPRNVQDFKDHPVYALERHLRRNEVLVPGATPSGTIGAGSRGPLEKIYRRKDVRVARSADKWFRMGREVKPNEIPVKWLPKRARNKGSRLEEEEDDDVAGDAGTPVYTMDQTELYEPPPVRNGRVPKNKFGNIEVYVPSMVPKGGVHLIHTHAARAAYILGVDYAPALTGFQFKGRQGTAVLHGIVVAQDAEEAVLAVIHGLEDVEQEVEDNRRRLVALKLWRRFLMGLRIRERIWSGVDDEERRAADREAELEAELEAAESDNTEEFDMMIGDDDEAGGGFLIE